MLTKSTLLKYYKRKDIQEAMVEHAKNKEVGTRYGEIFGKRPDVLSYPRDIIELALQNVTSLHCSEEIWENPLSLGPTLTKKDLDELRIGWDLVLDIDCKIFEYSRICADLIIKFLQYCEVKDISIKFSGNKGFHIGIPFEAFPQQVRNTLTKNLFPEAPKKIAFYVKENIKEELGKRLLEFEQGNLSQIKDKVNLPFEEIVRYEKNKSGDKIAKLNVDNFLEIDTILLASRHLYRMPYSLHEKSGLASVPLDQNKVMQFEKMQAEPEKISISPFMFLGRNVSGESARRLLVQALDFEVKTTENLKPAKEKEYEEMTLTCPIAEDLFPPCIKLIAQGLEDGKKRGIFIMTNFLGKVGWSKTQIEEYLYRWNKEKNREPLRDVYIKGQLHHFNPGERLPPNCDNDSYCKGIGVCKPDNFCSRIKNPANYTLLKWKSFLQHKEEEENRPKRGRPKKKEEDKEKFKESQEEKKSTL